MVHTRYVRYREFDRLRHSDLLLAFLKEQGLRLSLTPAMVFIDLMRDLGMSAAEVAALESAPDSIPDFEPVNINLPEITGTPAVRQTLAVSDGDWVGLPDSFTFAYQWYADGNSIGSADNDEYLTVDGDYAKGITCEVECTNAEGAISAVTLTFGPLAGIAPDITTPVAVTGTAQVGQTLTVSPTIDGIPTPTPSYQWVAKADAEAEPVPIEGATSSTYELTEDEEGLLVGCDIAATNAEGEAAVTSAFTDAVIAA